jgi:DNA polymerase-3 subunit gamma/tau
VLGVADTGLLEELVDAVDTGDARRALLALERCVESGRDAGSFASDLEVHARELLVVQTLGELPAELSLTEEADARLRDQAGRVDRAVVVRLLELLGAALEGVRAGADPRTRLELALVKAARPEVDASTAALLARIERLERERGGVSAVAADRMVAVPATEPVPEVVEMRATAAVEVSETSAAPAPDLVPEPTSAEVAPESAPVEDLVPEPAPALEEPEAGESPPPVVSANDLESLQALWPAVVELVGMENKMLSAVLLDTRPVAMAGEDLTVAFASSAAFLKKKAEHPDNRAIVSDALRQLSGGRWRLSYELLEADAEPASGGDVPTEEEWVRRFMEEFDAEELLSDQESGGAGATDEHAQMNSEQREA